MRRVVAEHRSWYVASLTELFAQVFGSAPGHGRPEHAAQHFLMMRDGAMAGADIDGRATSAPRSGADWRGCSR